MKSSYIQYSIYRKSELVSLRRLLNQSLFFFVYFEMSKTPIISMSPSPRVNYSKHGERRKLHYPQYSLISRTCIKNSTCHKKGKIQCRICFTGTLERNIKRAGIQNVL